MKQIEIIPPKKPVTTEVKIPGCISYTIRALNLAAMSKDTVMIQNPTKSDDSYAMVEALRTLGITVKEGQDFFEVSGNISDIKTKEYEINIHLSGRAARTLLALLTIVPGTKILTCYEQFKKRPVGDLVAGLRQLGAQIEYLEKENYLPVKITSSRLTEGKISMKSNLSSQYFSAIMMIAPLVGNIEIDVIGEQASKPFIDITMDIMRDFGVEVTNNNYQKYTIRGNQQYIKNTYIVEADAIAASYFWGIAALTKSKIKVLHLGPQSKQGDIRFADLLGEMGCRVVKNENESWIEVEGTGILNGIQCDMNNNPDIVPTLAVVASFAQGITKITGIEHLKIKETDRIEAPKQELQKMGVVVSATDNSMTITGGNPQGASIETYGDHRMAMAFAVAGTKIPGIIINNPGVVNKSFPNYWETLESIGVGIEKEEKL